MIVYRSLFSALALVVGLAWWRKLGGPGHGKDPRTRPSIRCWRSWKNPVRAQKPAKEPEKHEKDAKPDRKPAEPASKAKPGTDAKPKPAGGQLPQSPPTAKTGSGDVSFEDKELDALLEKLGETKDEPAPEERSRSRPNRASRRAPPSPPPAEGASGERTKQKDQGLQGKDKEIDDKLEEFAGKKRKKKGGEQEEGSGPLGEIIKEMRDVEQRLGKPDTGEDTQAKQKQIVKQIDTLIEQMKQSGSSSRWPCGGACSRVRSRATSPVRLPAPTPPGHRR